jgi:hypothetical protein
MVGQGHKFCVHGEPALRDGNGDEAFLKNDHRQPPLDQPNPETRNTMTSFVPNLVEFLNLQEYLTAANAVDRDNGRGVHTDLLATLGTH